MGHVLLHTTVCQLRIADLAPAAGIVVWWALLRLAGCGPFVDPVTVLKVCNYVHLSVHHVHGPVLLQFRCDMPGAFPVYHPPYAAPYVVWHSGPSVARHHVAAFVAMARRGAAAAFFPLVAWHRAAVAVAMAGRCAAAVVVPLVPWCHVAAPVAVARRYAAPVAVAQRCAASACAPSVAAAALVHVATVAVKSRYGIVAAVRRAGAVACSARWQ